MPENTGTENSKEPETELSEQETKFLEALKQNEDATESLKLRIEYPFLREESTPQELKALVTDKLMLGTIFLISMQNSLKVQELTEKN